MSNDAVAIARASYEAYVAEDRAAIEALIAPDFHFTSPLDNRLDRATYFERSGRTAGRSRISNSSTSCRRRIACSSRMKGRPAASAFATRKS